MRHSSPASAFTLIELLMAMAIGLVISNIAMVSFIATQKYVKRVEALSAQNDAIQSMILWGLTKPSLEAAYPPGKQFRQMGGAITIYGTDFMALRVQEEVNSVMTDRQILYMPITKD